MNLPMRMRLDNASNIYPACLSKKYAALFRLSVTLNEYVNSGVLQSALEATVARIPSFGYTLKNGAFWWYLRKIGTAPKISELSPLERFDFSKNFNYMFRVSPDCNRIVLDVFHVLGDGNAALTFLLTLTGEYLRIRHGLDITYDSHVLDVKQQPRFSEIEDSFTTFAGKKGSLEKNDPAYHIQGTKEPVNVLHDIKVSIPMNEIKAVAKERGCTVTDILTASIVYALQKMHIEDPRPRKANVLKVNVPVDLRRVFGGRTLRNYSSYVNLGVDVTNGYRTFDEILKEVSLQKNLYTLPSNLEPKIAANVGLERNVGVRCIPRFIKKPVIDIINKLHGDRFCSQTLSNIGNVKLPAEMQPYVREMDFILGRQRGNAGAAAAIGYGDTLNVNFSRGIVEDDFENYFREQLLALGIRSDDKFIEVASACTPTSFRCEASPVWK